MIPSLCGQRVMAPRPPPPIPNPDNPIKLIHKIKDYYFLINLITF